MSQRIVTINSLKSVSKVCNSRNYTFDYAISTALFKKFSTAAARFDSDFRNPSNCDAENRVDYHHQNSGFNQGNLHNQEFSQTPGGLHVQNQRNELLNSQIGENGSFLGGYNQENNTSEFRNDSVGVNWRGPGGFSREGRIRGNGEYSQTPSGFHNESLNNTRSSLNGVSGAGAVQQKQNQFYGVGSAVVNGSYGQNTPHSQQSSGNYSIGNIKNVGTSNSYMESTDNFHGNNYHGNVVGSHQQSSNSYHGNNAEGFNGYPMGNVGDYRQNPNMDYHTNTGPQQIANEYQNVMGFSQVAGNLSASAGLVEASEGYQSKVTVEEIDGLCQEGKLKEAIEMLVLLEQQGIPVDMARYFMLMKACGEANALDEAKHVHDLFNGRKFPNEVSSFNKILEMYCICGSMDDAYGVFSNMPLRNLTSWDTMILWLAKNGRGEEAIDLFTQFKQLGLQPDGQIFFSVFLACSFLGDITEGLLHFKSMSKHYGIVPSMQHYIGVVDMLGSTGYLDEALEFIENMPVEPSIDVWETLMIACRVHGNMELGDRCAELVELVDPSHLPEQSKAGLIPVKASDIAKEKEKKKLTSQNLLQVRSRQHEYRAGDTSHPDNDKIYALLRGLRQQMKEAGYVAETRFVLHDIDQEGKEDALLAHSERLAVAQGLLSSPARQQIRIIKNLRVCGDCHTAMKIISKLVGRELIMRDAKRFHHFKDGVCSCRDYW